MARMARRLLRFALAGGMLALPAAPLPAQPPLRQPNGTRATAGAAAARYRAQPWPAAFPAPAQEPENLLSSPQTPELLPETAPSAVGPEFLQSLPRPLEQPRSLFAPAPVVGPPPPDQERPFLDRGDPILDPPQWPQPGWFFDVQVGAVLTHISDQFTEQVTTGLGTAVTVQPGTAHLDWTVAPRFELGYRLPSGFGELSISNRFFNTQGSQPTIGPDGPAMLSTTFFVNYTDFDYSSREYTPSANWGMKWWLGLRAAETFFSSRLNEPFAEAAAGSTVFLQGVTNRTTGFGPHVGVELDRRFPRPGMSWINKIDLSNTFTRVKQVFGATTTTLNPGGMLDSGAVVDHFLQQVPILTVQTGLSWRPPRWRYSHLYLGYFGQFWYQFGTNSNSTSGPFFQARASHFDNEGVVLQWSLNL